MKMTLDRFARDAAVCTKISTVFSLLEEILQEVGLPYYALGTVWGDAEAVDVWNAPVIKMNYPEAWIETYFRKGYQSTDPVLYLMPYAATSLTWSQLTRYRPELFQEAADHGLRTGMSVPWRGNDRCYVMSVASDEIFDIPVELQTMVEMIAAAFFGTYIRLRKAPSANIELTPHTVEVIRLAMAGKSTPEIQEELRISKHGVYWCLKDAKEKLEANTQAQLFARAIQTGVVTI